MTLLSTLSCSSTNSSKAFCLIPVAGVIGLGKEQEGTYFYGSAVSFLSVTFIELILELKCSLQFFLKCEAC